MNAFLRLIFLLLVGSPLPCSAATIPVVKSWGDLLGSNPITVVTDKMILPGDKKPEKGAAHSIKVWVGIDKNHVSRNGGLLLYCLSQGVSFSRDSDQDLGPFTVEVQGSNAHFHRNISQYEFSAKDVFDKTTYQLFIQAVPLGDTGKYAVSLTPSDKPGNLTKPKIVAAVEVTVADDGLPWSPWGGSKKEQLRWPSLGHGGNVSGMTDTYTSITVANPVGGVAIPKAPLNFVSYPEVPAENTPLPQLIPDQPDPNTHFKLVENSLIVTMNHEIAIDFPDDRFLTRWWVNDKPYTPDPNPKDPEAKMMRNLGARVWDVKEVHFEVDFRPERLGAKKGDRIGVQVLFCPAGWQRFGAGSFIADLMESAPTDRLGSLSFPSNRIDFIYSGDPLRFEQK